MQPINLFLARFAQLQPSDSLLKEVTRRVIGDQFKIDLEVKDIKVSRQAVYVQVSPALRNLIFINREKIADLVRRQLGESKERKLL
jgi:hypothetical protein